MKNYILIFCMIPLIAACNGDRKNNMESLSNLKNISVVNAEDPICHMSTLGSISDTLMHKGSLYGFCSTDCKTKFKKQPEIYAVPPHGRNPL